MSSLGRRLRPPRPFTSVMVLLEALLLTAAVAARINHAITGNDPWNRHDGQEVEEEETWDIPLNEASRHPKNEIKLVFFSSFLPSSFVLISK